TSYPKDYRQVFGESGGVRTAPASEDILPNLDDMDFEEVEKDRGGALAEGKAVVQTGTDNVAVASAADGEQGAGSAVDATELQQVADILGQLPQEMQAVLADRERTAVQQDRADNKDDFKKLM
ncbi:MAG: hypothetical protein ACYCS8_04945, partial [Acidithiobacillus sp.]